MSVSSDDEKRLSGEKPEVAHIEDVENGTVTTERLAQERKIIHHVDRRILLVLGMGYAVSLADRSNLSVARLAGMEEDLHISIGSRYTIVALVFFIPYIVLQLPLNAVLRHFGPRRCLSFYIMSWGLVQIGMSFSPSWNILALCRALLGACEAGFFPGMVFVISTWYVRHEVQKRLAFFYLVSIGIGGFGSIFAYLIQLLHGKGGLNGWQWIFLIGGLITVVIAVACWLFVPDFPDQNTFLTKEETQIILDRVQRDRGDALPDKITPSKVFYHLSDWTMWAGGLMFMCSTSATYAMGYFLPIILAGMGWNTAQSLLLTAPPWVAASISSFLFAIVSDKTKRRGHFIAIQACMTLTGLFIAAYAKPNGVRYFGLFLVNMGGTGCLPSVLAYNANNVVSHSKRSVSTALVIGFGGIGGIFATTVFRQQDYPRYLNGLWATIGCQFCLLTCLAVLSFTYSRRNRLHRAGKWNGHLEGQPGFYYTL